MNLTIDLVFFIFILGFGLYIVHKLEYDIKLVRILKSYPVVSKIRGEGLVDFSNLSALIKGYDIEYAVQGSAEVERLGEGIYKVRARSDGKVVFKIVAYGNFDEYSVEKIVETLG